MPSRDTRTEVSRRDLLRASALAPVALVSLDRLDRATPAAVVPPPYTLSINIEIMFRATRLTRADRIRFIADRGFKAYSFWSADEAERAAMLKAQKETGLTCVSLVGTGTAGGTTGFTRPGAADALLGEFRERIAIARQFGTPDLISFVGELQADVSWETQRTGIVDGLKRAGDLAAAAGVTITVEPLSVGPKERRRALDRTAECYPVIRDVGHPNVKVCFDLYHLQRTEGNLVENLRRGLQEPLIKIVQIGDNPGRLEPGTGEIHYPFVFKELRRLNYRGYLDTEMGTSSTPEHAMDVARRLSEEN
ncbi:MAG: TIM barrel protein [Acidobacteria bacterium]|nr:TIM barrel protein [Acidobacteriota bacterium]